MSRGQYKYQERAKQLIRFDGCKLEWTRITPTDVDAIIEYHNKTFIIVEVKRAGVDVPIGQDMLIQRFIIDGIKAGKRNLGIVLEHDVKDPNQDIFLKDCRIRLLYFPIPESVTVVKKPPTKPDMRFMECVNEWIKFIERNEIS